MYIKDFLHHLTNYIIDYEPFTDAEGYEDPICHGTVTAYDIQDDGTTAQGYGAYDVKISVI